MPPVGLSAPRCALFIKILDQAIAFFLLEQLSACQEYRDHFKGEGGRERALWRWGQRLPCPGEFPQLPVLLYSLGSSVPSSLGQLELRSSQNTRRWLRTLLDECCPVLAPGPWAELKILSRETAVAVVQEQAWGSARLVVCGGGRGDAPPFSCCGNRSQCMAAGESLEVRGEWGERVVQTTLLSTIRFANLAHC